MADTEIENQNLGQVQGDEDQTEVNEAGTAGNEGDQGAQLTVEQYQANATRANQQAAAERVKRQELATELEAMRGKIGAMKSIDEVDALVGDFQSKLQRAEQANNRLLAAQAVGLPAGFEARLQGDTYEELLADAQALAPQVVVKPAPAPLPLGGGRDPKTAAQDDDPGAGWKAAKRRSQ